MAKIGDTVRFLNTTGGGKITKIEGRIAYVEEDGFETPVLQRSGSGAPLPVMNPKRRAHA